MTPHRSMSLVPPGRVVYGMYLCMFYVLVTSNLLTSARNHEPRQEFYEITLWPHVGDSVKEPLYDDWARHLPLAVGSRTMPPDNSSPRPQQKAPAPITSNSRAFQSGTRAPPQAVANPRAVQQLKPNALPGRQSASNILVSSRQQGNPILKEIKSQAWEYADIPADYVLGATTCGLYLSLKYHRLHPHYIYNRIRDLGGRYNLRVLLVMIDVTNHEEHLKELSKTSLINNVTLILCWSAAEAGRYLELYKTYEHASATMIKAPVSQAHGDKLVEFITTPRSINKTDAMSLVGNFGSVRTAVNARPEELQLIPGWGPTKVKQWHAAVTEPFRTRRAAKRGLSNAPLAQLNSSREGVEDAQALDSASYAEVASTTLSVSALSPEVPGAPAAGRLPEARQRPPKRAAENDERNTDEEEAIKDTIDTQCGVGQTRFEAPPGTKLAAPKPRQAHEGPQVSDGVLAALARLRDAG